MKGSGIYWNNEFYEIKNTIIIFQIWWNVLTKYKHTVSDRQIDR